MILLRHIDQEEGTRDQHPLNNLVGQPETAPMLESGTQGEQKMRFDPIAITLSSAAMLGILMFAGLEPETRFLTIIGLFLVFPSIALLLSGKPWWALLALFNIAAWVAHPVMGIAAWLSAVALSRIRA